jgi:hypothetical protein
MPMVLLERIGHVRRAALLSIRNWLSTSPEPMPRLRPRQVWLLVIPAAYLFALGACWLYGTPSKLPGVALGLPLLLNLEQAASVLATFAAVLIFSYLTSRGFLPTGFGNVSYPDLNRQHESERRTAELDSGIRTRVSSLEEGGQRADTALALIQRELERLEERLTAVESDHEN